MDSNQASVDYIFLRIIFHWHFYIFFLTQYKNTFKIIF